MDVTVNPTPSQELVAKAQAEISVTDARGRVIKLRKPGVLAQYRLVEVLGDRAKNEVYMSMSLPLIYVGAIDGDPVFTPAKFSEHEALIQRLDEDGIAAVVKGVNDNFAAHDPEGDRAAVKN